MGAIVRPVGEKDKIDFVDKVSKVYRKSVPDETNTTESTGIFYSYEERRMRNTVAIEEQGPFNRRGYINLAMPVMNYFLAGNSLELLASILKIKSDELVSIAEGDVVYDYNIGEALRAKGNVEVLNRQYDVERYLVGAQYVRKLIEELDVEYEIVQILLHKLNPYFGVLDESVVVRRDTEDEDYFWVIDDYYISKRQLEVNYDGKDFATFLTTIEKEWSVEREMLISGDKPRLTLLIGLRNNGKETIINQVLNFVVVMPIGYRPRVKLRKTNATTDAYNQLIRRSQNLEDLLILTQSNLDSIITAYKSLVLAVKHLMISNELKKNDTTYKPIAESLKGKKGVVRWKMEGVRIDYSARSVIIVDPDMSIDTIGIPMSIATKVLELFLVKEASGILGNNLEILTRAKASLRKKMAKELLEGKYGITGRQPTLFYLGIKAFKIKIVEGSAIVLNPLCTPSFNADFDGDQMHFEIPISDEARKEVANIMASTNNLFLSRNGECHVAPRQEILHGLWKASTASLKAKPMVYEVKNTEGSYKWVYEDVCTQDVNIYDGIEVGGKTKTAGRAALQYALGWDTYGKFATGVWPLVEDEDKCKPVTEKWFKKLLGHIALQNVDDFVTIVNRLTKLGFSVANIHPPNMSVLKYPDVSALVEQFDRDVELREEFYNMGLETDEAFTAFYDKAYTDLEKKIKALLAEQLDSSCGYVELMNSGARGSMSNVMQLFGMKGRVMKNENEAFNAILKHPLASQLTGLEHAITAYGSRQGLIDKTVATYEPGYLYRQLAQTSAYLHITSEDCGTTDGLLIDYELIRHFIAEQELTGVAAGDNNKFREFVSPILVGRYIVGREKMVTSVEQAEAIYDEQFATVEGNVLHKLGGIKLRSPITCKNPCCEKCYGIDLATNRKAVPGTPIGFIAAQSISEPSTQLIMKNFQNGGVAGISNLTSSFDMLENYMHLKDLRTPSKPIQYDYISPADGYVSTVSKGDGIAQLRITNEKGKSVLHGAVVLVYEGIEFKKYVKAGESVQKVQGDLNMREVIAYKGVDFAQKYLALKLYEIFHKNVEVNLKHFEAVVACMTFYDCLRGDGVNFKFGCKYTMGEWSDSPEICVFKKSLCSVRDVPLKKTDVFSTMFMERMSEGLAKSIITSGYDKLNDPIVRTAFGLSLGMGTDYLGYLEKRGKIPVDGYDVQ